MDSGNNRIVGLPAACRSLLGKDFYVAERLTRDMVCGKDGAVVFDAGASLLVKRGKCKAEINQISYEVEGPCVVNAREMQGLRVSCVSEDFDASCILMSRRFSDKLFLLLQDCRIYPTATGNQIVSVSRELLPEFERFYKHIADMYDDSDHEYSYQAMVLAVSSFFFENGYKCYIPMADKYPHGVSRILDRFMTLVQQNYKRERFLNFYADRLMVTPKHLSRTVKMLTGFTAVEWIERYVVLEAKVLLKSTNLNIQQVAEELNFHSQSFFGKYFKKKVGVSPKDFRNS